MLKNTTTTYGAVAKLLHWGMAALFVLMFTLGYIMINMRRSPLMFALYVLHKSTGMLLLFLCMLRVIWRLINIKPAYIAVNWLQANVAKNTVITLYLLMLAMPLTGFLTSTLGGHVITIYWVYSIAPLAQNIYWSAIFTNYHYWLSWVLVTLVSLHMLGAFFHHFIVRDTTLKRMWWQKKQKT